MRRSAQIALEEILMATQPKVRTGVMALGFAVALLLSCGVSRADSLFNGAYDAGNWTTTLTNSDGSVDTSGAPASILLTGPNNGDSLPGETLFSITAPATATLTFDWVYSTFDCCGSVWDPAGYEINGAKFQLSKNSGVPGVGGSGETTVSLSAGDSFGFYVDSKDNLLGPGTLEISGAPTSTPESSALSLLAVGLLGIVGIARLAKRRETSYAASQLA
jgi:hypothetical protein